MASALIGGLIKQGTPAGYLYAIEPNAGTRERLEKTFRIVTADAPSGKLADYDAIVMAVKPQTLKEAAEAIRPFIAARQMVISIAAGIRSTDVARWLGEHPLIVRAMPNTPALVGLGVTGLLASPRVTHDGRMLAEQVLEAVGEVVWCNNEAEIDSITALSGSGPAYVFYFMEALQAAAQNLGFPADEARRLAIGTFTGCGRARGAIRRAAERAARTRDVQGRHDRGRDRLVHGIGHRRRDRARHLGRARPCVRNGRGVRAGLTNG